jgi:hypothetical protein
LSDFSQGSGSDAESEEEEEPPKKKSKKEVKKSTKKKEKEDKKAKKKDKEKEEKRKKEEKKKVRLTCTKLVTLQNAIELFGRYGMQSKSPQQANAEGASYVPRVACHVRLADC